MISNSDLRMLLSFNSTDIILIVIFLLYNTIDYVAPDLCIGYQYLSLGHIQTSPLVVSHTMHSSFKYDSTLFGHASFLQLGCFCIGYIYTWFIAFSQ